MSRLKDLRRARGLTQVQMQLLTGIDQSDYSKIESGKRYYTFEQCRRIALALHTSMDYLAGLTDDDRPYPLMSHQYQRSLLSVAWYSVCILLDPYIPASDKIGCADGKVELLSHRDRNYVSLVSQTVH